MRYGMAFGINYLQLTRPAKSRFQGTYAKPLSRRAGLPCRFYFDLILYICCCQLECRRGCNFKMGVSVDRVRGRRWDRLENLRTS